jgi:undecaprenyl-diphosphatase
VNYQLADAINDLSGHSSLLDDLMSFAARDLIFVAFALFGLRMVPVVRSRDWGRMLRVAATLGLAFILGLAASQVYAEQRPFTTHHDIHRLISHAAGQSFPSDHATAAFALGFAMLVFVSRTWGLVLLGLAVVIGLARIYTGVHYPGDILGSLAVVLLALGIVELARRVYGQVGASVRSA